MALSWSWQLPCGSYQQASYYDNDGIYTSGNRQVSVERPPKSVQKQQEDPYADYFGQQANQYDEILQSEIFTDVDSYTSGVQNDSTETGQLADYYRSQNDYTGQGRMGGQPQQR